MNSFKMLGLAALVCLAASCEIGVEGRAEGDEGSASFAPAGSGDGLAATYFDEIDFRGRSVARVDAAIDFAWGRGGPDGISPNTFSVRWVGFVEPRVSETYRFHVTSDDGARLRVANQLLVNEMTDHGPRTFSGAIALEAGRRYPIQLEYYENGGGAMVRLEWSSASQARQVVPRSQLYTSDDVGGGATVSLDLDDAFVDSAVRNSNFDTSALEVDGDPSTKFALIKPRNMGSIPAGSRVSRATLVLRSFDGGNNFGVHELTGSWSERSVSFANAPGRSGRRATVSGRTGTHNVDLTSIVQSWVDGAPAHGIALYPMGTNGVDIHSTEDPTANDRPRLVVELAGGTDACPQDPSKTSPGECGCGVPEGTCDPPTGNQIVYLGTTEVWDSNGQNMRIARPSGSRAGDTLVLVLHRTDDDLPLYVDGWTRVAECYKRDNGYDCSTEEDCTRYHNDDFCAYFGDRGREGHDLAQAVFVRTVRSGEPSSYVFNLNVDASGHPGWAILTALRGVDTRAPVRDWSFKGCDNSSDSVFPSVFGEEGDLLLLSQSFDDAIAQSRFREPSGMDTFGYVSNSDEAGFLFGGTLTRTGETGTIRTRGDGGPGCKDALISLTVKPR